MLILWGRYDVEVLKSPKILYRAGYQSNPLGQWFTESAPHSEIEVRINTAVKPIWTDRSGNYTGSSPLNTVYEIKIPAGTTIYRGTCCESRRHLSRWFGI